MKDEYHDSPEFGTQYDLACGIGWQTRPLWLVGRMATLQESSLYHFSFLMSSFAWCTWLTCWGSLRYQQYFGEAWAPFLLATHEEGCIWLCKNARFVKKSRHHIRRRQAYSNPCLSQMVLSKTSWWILPDLCQHHIPTTIPCASQSFFVLANLWC